MASFNPFALRPHQQGEAITRQFMRPGGHGKEEPFSLTFRPMSEPEKGIAQDLRDTFIARYMGDPDNDIEPEMEFPPLDGGAIPLSRSLLQNAAIMTTQQPEEAPDRFDTMQFIAMSATLRPSVWQSVLKFSNEVTEIGLKNA